MAPALAGATKASPDVSTWWDGVEGWPRARWSRPHTDTVQWDDGDERCVVAWRTLLRTAKAVATHTSCIAGAGLLDATSDSRIARARDPGVDDPWVSVNPSRPLEEALKHLAQGGWALAPPRWQPGGGIYALRGHINSEAAILLIRERGWGARRHLSWIWGVQESASGVTDARFQALLDPGREEGWDPTKTMPDWARRPDRDDAWRMKARGAAWWHQSARHATLIAISPTFTTVNQGGNHWYIGLSLRSVHELPWPTWETTLWPALWARTARTRVLPAGTTTAQIEALREIWDAIAQHTDP